MEPALTPEQRIAKLGLVLPPPATPSGAYLESKRIGRMLYLAGHGPIDGSSITTGVVGKDMTTALAAAAAQLTGLSLLSTMNAAVGLDQVEGILSVHGYVNCVPWFTDQPAVIDGCSNLFLEVFGDAGKHVRCALGVGSLPFGIPVEIECVALLREEGAQARAEAKRK
ncbi:MAG TPA: RidA family protein [Solirubrobacteraceae bacterium]|jgi:enamine deaminase RidA (YjgF/YER057c/UK114 family)|nr:RidA family protein [Solirubrobacteraceae bacterium]